MGTSTLPRKHRITADEFQRMGEAGIFSEDDRVELIEGEIIDMAPIGSRHAAALSQLNRIFTRGTDAIVRIQDPIRLAEDSEPQPDLVLAKPREDHYSRAHPGPQEVLLLIEVADASADYDRNVKILLYARHGIPEVWLVDIPNQAIEVFRTPSPNGYREHRRYQSGELVRPLLCPEVEIDPGDILP